MIHLGESLIYLALQKDIARWLVNQVECQYHQKVEIVKAQIHDYQSKHLNDQFQKLKMEIQKRKAKSEYQFEDNEEKVLFISPHSLKISLRKL